jgi:hypothetical protein
VYLLGFHAYFLLGILIFKGLTARRLYKSFGVNGLIFSQFVIFQEISYQDPVCLICLSVRLTSSRWSQPASCTSLLQCHHVPVAARSKALVCGSSLAGIVGSYPTGGMDVCMLWVLCVGWWRSLRLAVHSSRGVLSTVVCRCVWSRNPVYEQTTVHWALLRQNKNNITRCPWLA